MDFILGSKSPRRKELLSKIVPSFVIKEPPYAEDLSLNFSCSDLVLHLAEGKSLSLQSSYKNSYILTADTLLEFKGKPLGKPQDEKEAFEMLSNLSGQSHNVLTALCFYDPNQGMESILVSTEVTFCLLTSDMIHNYILSEDVLDAAGSYKIQGLGELLVQEIKGSYTNVVGLPLRECYNLIQKSLDKKII